MDLKENKGAIFKNTNKTDEKHPDYKGKLNVDGKEKDIALWVRESKNGEMYMSATITEPYKKEVVKDFARAEKNDLPF